MSTESRALRAAVVASAILVVGVGVFAVVCAWQDWDWFMEDRRAQPVIALIGRQGARAFYGSLGLLLVPAGILLGTRRMD
ncbi:MAG: immunity 17 family protein [Myxococcales bacterium]|nr:immunity 17 family protein [Myxococcales bacterium]